MWRSLQELQGYRIRGTDGEIGRAVDFYFDDRDWFIRYLIVDTGHWFPGRRVLIPSPALERPDWESQTFPVRLTRKQIQESSGAEREQTVADYKNSQIRRSMLKSGGFPLSWGHHEPFMIGVAGAPPEAIALMYEQERDVHAPQASNEPVPETPHLRSAAELIEYGIKAMDGEIGHAEDFLLDDNTWQIGHVVVDTGTLLPGKEVLVPRKLIRLMDWGTRTLSVSLVRNAIEASPEFDPEAPISEGAGIRRYDPSGRAKN